MLKLIILQYKEKELGKYRAGLFNKDVALGTK